MRARAARLGNRSYQKKCCPLIRKDCRSEVEIYVAGAAFGGCSALGLACRFPDLFRGAIAMSMPLQHAGAVAGGPAADATAATFH